MHVVAESTFCLLMCLLLSRAQIVGEPPVIDGSNFSSLADSVGQSYLSLALLAVTVGLSGSVYLCVLRYICSGCCKPVPVGPQTDGFEGEV